MLTRRAYLGLVAVAFLAACESAPLITSDQAANLAVRDVSVDMAGFQGVTGREITVSAETVNRDVSAELAAQLRPSAAGNADVRVAVNKVALVSPGQSFLLGGVSTISGTVMVIGSDGKVIVPATAVTGTADGGYAPGGIIGAINTKSPEVDYNNTVASFAADVKQRLFGTKR